MIRTMFAAGALATSLALAATLVSAETTLTVRDAWSRPAVETGVAYFTIVNHGSAADRLLDVSSPVAAHVEIHQTVHGASGSGMSGMSGMSGSGMSGSGMSGSGMSGVMTMKRVDAIPVPAGGEVTLKPGSYHVMLIGLKKPLKTGDAVELHLRFEKAGKLDVSAPVQATAP
jgi:copper(I)-binding protein